MDKIHVAPVARNHLTGAKWTLRGYSPKLAVAGVLQDSASVLGLGFPQCLIQPGVGLNSGLVHTYAAGKSVSLPGPSSVLVAFWLFVDRHS